MLVVDVNKYNLYLSVTTWILRLRKKKLEGNLSFEMIFYKSR